MMEKGRTIQQHSKKRGFPVGKDPGPWQRWITSPKPHSRLGCKGSSPPASVPIYPASCPKPILICLPCPSHSHPPFSGQSVLASLPARELMYSLHICIGFMWQGNRGVNPPQHHTQSPQPEQSLQENVANQAHVQDEKQTLWKTLL